MAKESEDIRTDNRDYQNGSCNLEAPDSRFANGLRILHGEQEYITYREYSSIRIWDGAVPDKYARHYHSAVEIVLPTEGTVVYELPLQTYRVMENEILIIPSESPHALSMSENSARFLYLFEPSILMRMRDTPLVLPMINQPIYLNEDSALRRKITALLLEIRELYIRRECMWNTMCYSLIMQIYVQLGKQYLSCHEVHTAKQQLDPEFMNTAITYISQHYMQNITLDDVADFVGFSKHYFSRKFKQYLGRSFTEYLTQNRIAAAEEHLVHSNEAISVIASKCGFQSIATFNRTFREWKHCTPTQYRSMYGVNNPMDDLEDRI